MDTGTQIDVQRTLFSEPKTWEESVAVEPGSTTSVKFTLSEK
jgi:hypothetical protein